MDALAYMIASSDALRILMALIAFGIAALLLMVLLGLLYVAGMSFVAAMQDIDRKRSGHPPEAAPRPNPDLAKTATWTELESEERRFMAAEAAKILANEQADRNWREAASS